MIRGYVYKILCGSILGAWVPTDALSWPVEVPRLCAILHPIIVIIWISTETIGIAQIPCALLIFIPGEVNAVRKTHQVYFTQWRINAGNCVEDRPCHGEGIHPLIKRMRLYIIRECPQMNPKWLWSKPTTSRFAGKCILPNAIQYMRTFVQNWVYESRMYEQTIIHIMYGQCCTNGRKYFKLWSLTRSSDPSSIISSEFASSSDIIYGFLCQRDCRLRLSFALHSKEAKRYWEYEKEWNSEDPSQERSPQVPNLWSGLCFQKGERAVHLAPRVCDLEWWRCVAIIYT